MYCVVSENALVYSFFVEFTMSNIRFKKDKGNSVMNTIVHVHGQLAGKVSAYYVVSSTLTTWAGVGFAHVQFARARAEQEMRSRGKLVFEDHVGSNKP